MYDIHRYVGYPMSCSITLYLTSVKENLSLNLVLRGSASLATPHLCHWMLTPGMQPYLVYSSLWGANMNSAPQACTSFSLPTVAIYNHNNNLHFLCPLLWAYLPKTEHLKASHKGKSEDIEIFRHSESWVWFGQSWGKTRCTSAFCEESNVLVQMDQSLNIWESISKNLPFV